MAERGSGSRNSRQFVEDLENLGYDGGAGVSISHTQFGGAMPSVNLNEVLAIFADLVQKPHLLESQFDDAKLVCLQEVRAVEDELSQKLMQELRRRHYAEPWGRSQQGNEAALESMQLSDVKQFVGACYQPQTAILSVAGKIEWERLQDQVAQLFGEWKAQPVPQFAEQPRQRGYTHLEHDASETHIGVAFDSVPYADPDYYQLRGAIGVLSDGMSSRLFTEVREKRGLVYTVYASCHSLRDRGSVISYAGTTTDKAQETLDVLLGELQKLPQGVHDAELARLKAHIKTSIIMQQESSRSRASSMAGDWYHLGRVRSMEELQGILDSLTSETINRYLLQHPPGKFTICTLGEKELEIPREIL
jgi:predicted Zn-dependent peptidase